MVVSRTAENLVLRVGHVSVEVNKRIISLAWSPIVLLLKASEG